MIDDAETPILNGEFAISPGTVLAYMYADESGLIIIKSVGKKFVTAHLGVRNVRMTQSNFVDLLNAICTKGYLGVCTPVTSVEITPDAAPDAGGETGVNDDCLPSSGRKAIREAFIRGSGARVQHWSKVKQEAFYEAVRRINGDQGEER